MVVEVLVEVVVVVVVDSSFFDHSDAAQRRIQIHHLLGIFALPIFLLGHFFYSVTPDKCVGPNCQFTSVGAAVAEAEEGDTIHVESGVSNQYVSAASVSAAVPPPGSSPPFVPTSRSEGVPKALT